jgi:hypothetical protein
MQRQYSCRACLRQHAGGTCINAVPSIRHPPAPHLVEVHPARAVLVDEVEELLDPDLQLLRAEIHRINYFID